MYQHPKPEVRAGNRDFMTRFFPHRPLSHQREMFPSSNWWSFLYGSEPGSRPNPRAVSAKKRESVVTWLHTKLGFYEQVLEVIHEFLENSLHLKSREQRHKFVPPEQRREPSVKGSLSDVVVPFPHKGFPGGSDGKASACNEGDPGSIPGSGRSPGEGNGNPLQYSCLENSMDRGAL